MAVKSVVCLVGTGAFAFCFGIAFLARAQPAEAPPAASFPSSAAAPPPSAPPVAAPGPAYTQYGEPPPYVPPQPQPLPYPYYSPPPPPAAASPEAPASWGLGAGFGLNNPSIPGVSQSPGNTLYFPSYLLSLERRLGSSTWLTLNASFRYSRTQQPVTALQLNPDPTRTTLELTTFEIAGLLGIRQVVVKSIVDLSLFGSVGIGRSATGGDDPLPDEFVAVLPGGSVNSLLFIGGLAVERRLIEGLAVRLSAGILSASTSRAEVVGRDNGETKITPISSQTIDLSLRPMLELFFYF